MGFVGQVAPNFGIDNMVLFMRGPDDGWLRVALERGQRDQARRVSRAARKVLPERIIPWMAERLEHGGGRKDCRRRRPAAIGAVHLRFRAGRYCQPGDELRRSKPIAVRVVGTDL